MVELKGFHSGGLLGIRARHVEAFVVLGNVFAFLRHEICPDDRMPVAFEIMARRRVSRSAMKASKSSALSKEGFSP